LHSIPTLVRPTCGPGRSTTAFCRTTYPNIAAVASNLPALDDPTNFETALELMLDALRARARKARSDRRAAKPTT